MEWRGASSPQAQKVLVRRGSARQVRIKPLRRKPLYTATSRARSRDPARQATPRARAARAVRGLQREGLVGGLGARLKRSRWPHSRRPHHHDSVRCRSRCRRAFASMNIRPRPHRADPILKRSTPPGFLLRRAGSLLTGVGHAAGGEAQAHGWQPDRSAWWGGLRARRASIGLHRATTGAHRHAHRPRPRHNGAGGGARRRPIAVADDVVDIGRRGEHGGASSTPHREAAPQNKSQTGQTCPEARDPVPSSRRPPTARSSGSSSAVDNSGTTSVSVGQFVAVPGCGFGK